MSVYPRLNCLAIPVFVLLGLSATLLWGQTPQVVRAEAYPGQPFGVGKISFRTGQQGKLIQSTGGLMITDAENRLFYPAFTDGLLSNVIDRNAVGGMHSVWFLFRGDQPLTITLHGAVPVTFTVTQNFRRPGLARIAFQSWWRQFRGKAERQAESGDYPPMVETYLVSMLQRRLGLPASMTQRFRENRNDQLQETIRLMFDVESIRAESIRRLMKNVSPESNQATLPPPPPADWSAPTPEVVPDDVEIEAIARFVPQECYYLRFGNWKNQVWLKRLTTEFGGDLSQMLTQRGHRGGDTQKMLDQLVLESNQMDDWFGGNLIADVAAIGTDLYIEDGPSAAILMLARGNALQSQIQGRRKSFAREHADEGVTLTNVEIAGRQVSLLSTPDNRIRSFHAVEDLCHITSTSRVIVERFFEASAGNGSLATNAEFRAARVVLPLERDHTVFIYLSRAFFENLLSPHYQIELARRNLSLANIQLLQLAQWAAAHEGYADDDIDQMIQNGFLPVNFNQLPDGSIGNWIDGAWHDSIRGRRGYYLPIADANISAISPTENAEVAERIDYFQNQLREVDPMLISFKRFAVQDQIERVVIDARVAPFGKEKYGWVGNVLGPPMQVEIGGAPDELIAIQTSMSGNILSASEQPHQIFAAVQSDIPARTSMRPTTFFEMFQLLKTTPGYIGAWPNPGYLDRLPALGAEPDAAGFTYSRILDLWRLQFGEFSLLAFDRNRLEAMRDWVRIEPAERPAQLRLRVGDIANSNLRDWANVLYFERGWETSIANVRLLNMMIQQMGLPGDTALTQAQQLLGVELSCPLGGQYVYAATPEGTVSWQSTGWPSFDEPQVPPDYTAPPMFWFRGMNLDLYQRESQFVVHGFLDIQRGQVPETPPNTTQEEKGFWEQLPDFKMFKGFSTVEEAEPEDEDPAEADPSSAGDQPPDPPDDEDG